MTNSKTEKVHDLPTRLFHWMFAGLFLSAFYIAKTYDDDSAIYPYHMLLGMVMVSSVVFRVIWGIVGSRFAKFSSFELRPTKLFEYFKDLIRAGSHRSLAHNPASSWSALLMMGLTISLGITGYMMSTGLYKSVAEEIHELSANFFIITVVAHIIGIIVHSVKHRDAIGLSMIHGRKKVVDGQNGIESSHPIAAIVFMAMIAAVVFQLNKNYDPANGSLNLFGKMLQLGENEDEHGEQGDSSEHEANGSDDDD